MSESKSKLIKQSKPFSSLAYLAKSTFAINGSSGCSASDSSNVPNTASTAKVSEDPQPVAAATSVCNNHNRSSTNGHCCTAFKLGHNENTSAHPTNCQTTQEQPNHSCDEVDAVHRCPYLMPSSITATGARFCDRSSFPTFSKFNSMDSWDYTIELDCLQGPEDLQLAAELGKTLLERNKELELLIKEHKNTIEEQEQEIVYLKKHTTALREVNDSRLKVYEQLEVGIQDLERANHRLLVDNTSDKKHIKTLTHNIEGLETRCDELTKQLDEVRQSLAIERRKNDRLIQEKNNAAGEGNGIRLRTTEQKQPQNSSKPVEGYDANTTAPENCSFAFQSPVIRNKGNSTGISSVDNTETSLDLSQVCAGEDNEDIIKLVNDLETTRRAFMAEQQRCGELEEQLVAIIQENQTLQGRIAQTSANEEMKSVHDELSILDEVRQGQMCSRCLRAVDDRNTINDEQSSIAPTEEEEDDEERSLLDLDGTGGGPGSECSQTAYRSSVSIKAAETADTADETVCSICSKQTTIKNSYLHDQLPLPVETILLEVWQKTFRKLNIVRWIAKVLQWPALIICRMISSIPDDEDFALIF